MISYPVTNIISGYGVFAIASFSAWTFLLEYDEERITKKEGENGTGEGGNYHHESLSLL